MKKSFKVLAIAVMIAVALTGFFACSDPEEDVDPTTPGNSTATATATGPTTTVTSTSNTTVTTGTPPSGPNTNNAPYLLLRNIPVAPMTYGAIVVSPTATVKAWNPEEGKRIYIVSWDFTLPAGNLTMNQTDPILENRYPQAGSEGRKSPFTAARVSGGTLTGAVYQLEPGYEIEFGVTIAHPDRSGSSDSQGDFIEVPSDGIQSGTLVIGYREAADDGSYDPSKEKKSIYPHVQSGVNNPNITVNLKVNKANPDFSAAVTTIPARLARPNYPGTTSNTSVRITVPKFGAGDDADTVDGYIHSFEYTIFESKDWSGKTPAQQTQLLNTATWVTPVYNYTLTGGVPTAISAINNTAQPVGNNISANFSGDITAAALNTTLPLDGVIFSGAGIKTGTNYFVICRSKGSDNYLPGSPGVSDSFFVIEESTTGPTVN